MPLIIEMMAWLFLFVVLGIIGLMYAQYCQETADRLDNEEIERRAHEKAENAHVTIKQEIIWIDETKEGLLNAEV